MFRELTRKKQVLTNEECVRILINERRGVLSVNGDNGYPYGMPMNHFYCPEDGKLYFHSALRGHKVDAMEKCAKASFCVYDEGYRLPDEWPLYIKSVIVFGKIDIVDDRERIADITTKLSHKFTQDDAYIQKEIEQNIHRTLLLVLTPEHICGKLVQES